MSRTGQIQLEMVPRGMMMFCYFFKIYMSRENSKILLCSNYVRCLWVHIPCHAKYKNCQNINLNQFIDNSILRKTIFEKKSSTFAWYLLSILARPGATNTANRYRCEQKRAHPVCSWVGGEMMAMVHHSIFVSS